MSIMGNTCYYGKCSFCVQNNKYQNNELRKESFLLESCLDRIEALIRNQGLSSINFLDQAVSPSTLKVFCRKVIERGLRFNWYVRMLLHTRFDDELIELMMQDKKVRDGRINFILAHGIGSAFVTDAVDLGTVRRLLEEQLAARR